MEFEEVWQRGCLRKTWWDCVEGDMESFGLSHEDAQDMGYWRLKIKGETADSGPGKWPLKRCVCVSVCINVCYVLNGHCCSV